MQIKSGTSQAELDDYVGRFRRDGSCDRFFFVCHSPAGVLSLPAQPALHLWAAERLSDVALAPGCSIGCLTGRDSSAAANWLISQR